MQSGYLITDDGRVVDCNGAAERLVAGLLDDGGDDGLVGVRAERVFDAIDLDEDGEFSAVVDGQRRHFDVRSTTLEDDGFVIGNLYVFTDVTERVEARRELARERAEFDALFQGLGDPVVKTEVDEDGRPIVRRVNEAFEAVFGYSESRLRGENLDEFIVPPGREAEAREITRAAHGGDTVRREVVREADGERRRFLLRTAATGGSAVYAFYTDVTEQRRQQRELERQNERLEEFASVVSHDLRNPINVARGYLDAARRADDADPHLDEVATSLDRMEAIIEDVLSLARQGDDVSHPDRVQLSDAARMAWESVDTGSAHLVTDDLELRADPDRLLQLLENLFRNSIEHGAVDVDADGDGETDAAPEGTESDPDPAPTVTVGPLQDGRGFFVADDGPGIPPDHREKVFESGFTTRAEGTGFGLAIVERIAQAHGWSVGVTESRAGGTRFEFHLDGEVGPPAGVEGTGDGSGSSGGSGGR